MRQVPNLLDASKADVDLVCYFIFEQLEFLHADGRLDDEAWHLICALMHEHEVLLQAMRARAQS